MSSTVKRAAVDVLRGVDGKLEEIRLELLAGRLRAADFSVDDWQLLELLANDVRSGAVSARTGTAAGAPRTKVDWDALVREQAAIAAGDIEVHLSLNPIGEYLSSMSDEEARVLDELAEIDRRDAVGQRSTGTSSAKQHAE